MEGQIALNNQATEEMKEAFRLFDRDGDGSITKEELGTVLSFLGQKFTENELFETVKQVDGDGNGSIEFDEFRRVWAHEASNPSSSRHAEEGIRDAFLAIDKDQNGFISSAELFLVLQSLGAPSEEEVSDMIKQADKDGDGLLSYSEFRGIMMM